MLSKSKSENQIRFQGLDFSSSYNNVNCTDDTCLVFKTGKYGIQPSVPVATWMDSTRASSYGYLKWYITAQYCVPGLPDNTCTGAKGE